MRKALVGLSLALLLTGCSQSVEDIKMPKDDQEIQDMAAYVRDNMEGEDQALAQEVLEQVVMGRVLGVYPDTKLTLADAMEQKRKEKAAAAAKKQASQALVDEMNKAVEVVYINHKPLSKVGLSLKGYDFRVKFRNKQDKPVYGIKGQLIFTDPFGKQSGKIDVERTGLLNKNDNAYEQIQTFLIGGESFSDMDYSKGTVTFEPHVVVFADKSSVSIADN